MSFFKNISTRLLAAEDASRAMQLAGIIRFVCIFLQGIILVKAGVPLQIVGQIELVFFVANFFMFFWQNGANNAMLAWASGEERIKVAGAIFSATHVYALLAVCLMWIASQCATATQFDLISNGKYSSALLVYVFFSIPAGTIIYAYLVRQQYRAILWYSAFAHGLQVAIVTGMIIAGYDIGEMLWVLALFAITKWLFVLLSGRWFATGSFSLPMMWTFVAFAFPLIIHAFNSGLMDYVDGWIVSFFYGDDQFAIYRYGARELPFNALLIGGLMSGLIHRFMTKDAIDAASLRAEILRIMQWLFPINGALILLSAPLYTLIYNEDFLLSARIFNIYAFTLFSRVIMNQIYCYIHHRNWILTWSTAGEVVLNIGLSLLLMQWIGLLGIPLATVLAYAIQKVFLIWYVRRVFGARFTDYVPLPQCIWYFAGMILCMIIAELIYF